MKTSRVVLAFGLILTMGLMSFSLGDQEKWVVPDNYKKMKNPTDPNDEDGLDVGKGLYDQHCKSCHGKEGLGDGPKAAEQKGDLGDFSSDEFQAQTDGELFYKTKIGRDDMPNFEKKITDDEDLWLVVNYMRTMAE